MSNKRRFMWIAHNNSIICALGIGLQGRVEGSVRMLFEAMKSYHGILPDFESVSLSVDDVVCNVADLDESVRSRHDNLQRIK